MNDECGECEEHCTCVLALTRRLEQAEELAEVVETFLADLNVLGFSYLAAALKKWNAGKKEK